MNSIVSKVWASAPWKTPTFLQGHREIIFIILLSFSSMIQNEKSIGDGKKHFFIISRSFCKWLRDDATLIFLFFLYFLDNFVTLCS